MTRAGRLTVAQAVVAFLAAQYSERDGSTERLVPACFGIFGHGNVAGLGQALAQAAHTDPDLLPYHLGRNEQAMVHTAVGYARHRNRRQLLAVTTSIGPGATNLVTGAALATTNRIPVLLLPGDVFATRPANPVLQELEQPTGYDVSVNDTLAPVSRFFDRVWRPEQLPAALLGAMRVLTDPAETGAATICLPQDTAVQAHDWPDELFAPRTWHLPRPVPEPAALQRALRVLRGAQRPLLVAGGGVHYSQAEAALARFAEATNIPVADTQAGKGSLLWDHPNAVGGLGSTGSPVANALAAQADVVIGVGTRWSDFTTASRTVFAHPGVAFVNLNVTGLDAVKHAGIAVLADARAGLDAFTEGLAGRRWPTRWDTGEWDAAVTAAHHQPAPGGPELLTQAQVIGALDAELADRDVVVQAAGSLPGDLQRMWRARDAKAYHVEYAYSCMGYEIAGALGVKLAALAETADDPDRDREVFALVGDGSWLMMAGELVTAIAEGVKLNVVLVDNGGFASIGALSATVGAGRFGTAYRARNPESGLLDGAALPVDLAANAASLGAQVIRARTPTELAAALRTSRAAAHTTVVAVRTDPLAAGPDNGAWWDVPVAQVAELPDTVAARRAYERARTAQRPLLAPATPAHPADPPAADPPAADPPAADRPDADQETR